MGLEVTIAGAVSLRRGGREATDRFCRLRCSPDGRWLAIGDGRNGVEVLAVDLGELGGIAEESLTRTWMLDECREYLDSDECPA